MSKYVLIYEYLIVTWVILGVLSAIWQFFVFPSLLAETAGLDYPLTYQEMQTSHGCYQGFRGSKTECYGNYSFLNEVRSPAFVVLILFIPLLVLFLVIWSYLKVSSTKSLTSSGD